MRHRVFSFCQESQRYCNYSLGKFGNEITYIIPSWFNENKAPKNDIVIEDDWGKLLMEYYYHLSEKGETKCFKKSDMSPERNFITSLRASEVLYLELLNQGLKPQEARDVLPNACKTEIIMTGYNSD